MAISKGGHRISLLVEGYPRMGLGTFSEVLKAGSKGVCISRLHPDYVRQKYGLGAARCYWLSGCKGKEALSPRMLGQIAKTIRNSVCDGCDVAFLDGLEYLLLYNDMGHTIAFLEEVEAALCKCDAEMVVCIDPLTFEKNDLERLWAAYPRCTPEEMMMTLVRSRSPHSAGAGPGIEGQTI